ncbi:MAG: glutamine--fructose-6-phosphate transaminase (isomerizing) [bacterium]|jgi:glucosamine--fructose-6-phosphate aminotransferase (isomerizing)
MCGIVGYVGNKGAIDVLINGLKRLEYRGYDSAGIALIADHTLHVRKDKGKVVNVEKAVHAQWDETFLKSAHTGIAHTRWATHGSPTAENAHPHTDQTGRLALVHNGIIENYLALRNQLAAKGHTFKSQTDTEVLIHLIGELYQGNLFEAVCAALKHVEGTYGIAVVSSDTPDQIVVARKGSPLVIGVGDGETIVASDVAAIIAYTRQVIYLDDNDVAIIRASGAEIRNINNVPVSREIAKIDWDAGTAEKSGYEHFMLKEINEQPDSIRNTIRGRLDDSMATAILSGLALTPRELSSIERVVILGCGTSLNAGMVGKYYFEELADLPTDVEQAAEYRYRNPIIRPHDLVIAISQSGETADTLAAVREAKQKGALVVGLCNVVGSTIARETGRGVYLHAGPEISVASTKAFTCQLTVLLMLALKIGRCRRLSRQQGLEICEEIHQIPELIKDVLTRNNEIIAAAESYAQVKDFFFLGRGCLYPVAMEGALKLKEISYIHAEGYHAAELKHGPIALLDESVPVIAMLNDIAGREKMSSNVQECRARHAPVIGIVTDGSSDSAPVDAIIHVPKCSHLTAPIVTVVALQLFAYHMARIRNCPIDQPRNLAKSVTVE